jgi:hypothetical protein
MRATLRTQFTLQPENRRDEATSAKKTGLKVRNIIQESTADHLSVSIAATPTHISKSTREVVLGEEHKVRSVDSRIVFTTLSKIVPASHAFAHI